MLSGLRVVSREEAMSNVERDVDHKSNKSRHRSKKHRKEEKTRGKKHSRKSALRRTRPSSLDGSSSDNDEDLQILKSQRKNRSKRGRYSDASSSSSAESEELFHGPSSLPGSKSFTKEETSREISATARKAAGLDWMVQAPPSSIKTQEIRSIPNEVQVEEPSMQVNPKELNPYLKDGGEGYPSEDLGLQNPPKKESRVAPVIGDGGLSWRLKALKRAKEQAEREGRELDAVVEERWGSLADMTVSVSAKRAAHAHAHLHAIRDRKRIEVSKSEEIEEKTSGEAKRDRDTKRILADRGDYLKDVGSRDYRMKAPHATDSLSWKRRHTMRVEDREIFHEAASALNKFQNDGSFLKTFSAEEKHQGAVMHQEDKPSQTDDNQQKERGQDFRVPLPKNSDDGEQQKGKGVTSDIKSASIPGLSIEGMSANQVAAKALQLRLQGKSKEADAVLNKLQNRQNKVEELSVESHRDNERPNQSEHQASYKQSMKSIVGDYQQRRGKNDSGDAGLVESIVHNKQYNRLTCVDDEYDAVEGTLGGSKKRRQKPSKDDQGKYAKQAIQAHKRIVTQEERCQFCFNNPSRPKHLTVSIANSSYLMLPPWEPLVDGHCLLVPTQHEGSSRNVDENVWEELRNYKKCLLQMFAKQDRSVLFMETVINLAQQRRHCLVECIPLPPNVAKQAPLYFKKAIDEAEDEWSQHDAKKLIDTSGKGLRACIPKNFPYFHVEFGLHAGFVHVIDNEREFKSDFGCNVIMGMLKLPEEEMHRRRKQQSYEQQKKAAAEFQKAWDPFDWTKMLD